MACSYSYSQQATVFTPQVARHWHTLLHACWLQTQAEVLLLELLPKKMLPYLEYYQAITSDEFDGPNLEARKAWGEIKLACQQYGDVT